MVLKTVILSNHTLSDTICYYISLGVTSEPFRVHHIVEFVITSRLNAPFLIKCYYRQLSVLSITENIIVIEITKINGTGLLNGPMKA